MLFVILTAQDIAHICSNFALTCTQFSSNGAQFNTLSNFLTKYIIKYVTFRHNLMFSSLYSIIGHICSNSALKRAQFSSKLPQFEPLSSSMMTVIQYTMNCH